MNARLQETGLNEIEYGTGEWHLRVAKTGVGPKTVPVATPSVASEPVSSVDDSESNVNHPGVVVSPMVGTAYISPDPESPSFVQVGDSILEGDTLLLIEAMKVFNPIKAARSGIVTRVFINNGTPIEFGEPLMIIE